MSARRRFWSFRASTARDVADAIFANFLLHWFPARMRPSSLAWTPTFWLGTVSWVLFVVLLYSEPVRVALDRLTRQKEVQP